MKKNLLKIVAALTVTLCIFCSCGSKSGGGTLKIDGKDVNVQSVLKVGDIDVSYDMYRYWFLTIKQAMLDEVPNTDFTNKEKLDALKNKTLEQIKLMCATQAIADKYGIKLTKEHDEAIVSTMKETFNSAGSAKDYRALLAENFLTDEVYKEILEINTLSEYILSDFIGTDKNKHKILFTQADALKKCNEDFYRYVDIYFAVENKDEKGNDLPKDVIAQNKKEAEKKINAAYDKLESGKPFLEVMKEYRSGEEYEKSLLGYYKPESISNAFDIDAKALKVGEYTKVLYANGSYAIICRLENVDEHFIKNGVSPDGYNTLTMEQYYAEHLFSSVVEKQMEEFKVTEYKYYDKITPETLF